MMATQVEADLILNIIAKGGGSQEVLTQLTQIEQAAKRAQSGMAAVQQAAGAKGFVDAQGNVFIPGQEERIHKTAVATLEQAHATAQLTDATQKEGEQIQATKKVWDDMYADAPAQINANADAYVKAQEKKVEADKTWTAALSDEYSAFRKLQAAGRALGEVSTTFFVPSAAVLAGSLAWAQNYVKNAQEATATTIQWKAATTSLQYSQQKVGETLATIELPVLQTLARFATVAADFAQQNPELVQAGIGITGVVALTAGIGLLASKGIKMVADIQYLTAAAGQITSTNANTAALNANTLAQGGKTAGTVAGLGGGGILSSLSLTAAGGGVLGTGLGLGGVAAVGLPILAGLVLTALGGYLGIKELQREQMPGYMPALASEGYGPRITHPTQTTAGNYEAFASNNLALWTDYQKQITDATTSNSKARADIERTYEKERTSIVRDAAQQQAQMEADYRNQVARAYANFQRSEAEAEQNYYDSRLRAARDNSQRLYEMEQDHQISIRRMTEDHEDRQKSLLESLDGLAMIREDERYEKERRRAEEDYNLQVSRTSQQAAQTLRDNEAQFAAQRTQRLHAFRQELADAAANYKAEQARAKAEEEAKLKDLDTNYAEQLRTLQESYQELLRTLSQSFRDRIRAIDNSILGDQNAVQQASAQSYAAFIDWLALAKQRGDALLNTTAGGTTSGYKNTGHAAGGYLGNIQIGNQTFGEEGYEYLLSHHTTQFAEQAIGGRLTQERLISALSGQIKQYNDNRRMQFTGVTEADRAAIRRDIYSVTKEVLEDAFRN
jgi:hypothetical protein